MSCESEMLYARVDTVTQAAQVIPYEIVPPTSSAFV
jgi:hypothetical protein